MDQHTCTILEFNKILNLVKLYCYSPPAAEYFQKNNFYFNLSILNTKLSEVNEFIDILQKNISFPLSAFSDIRPSLRKLQIEGSFLSAQEYLEIRHVMIICRLIAARKDEMEAAYPLTVDKILKLIDVRDAETIISAKIDDEGTIRDDASQELRSIRQKMGDMKNKFQVKLQELLQRYTSSGILRESYITMRSGHYVFPVKVQNRTAISGIVYDQSESGSTIFIEPVEIVNFNNRILQLELDEKREIERILLDVANHLRLRLLDIDSNLKILAYIDSLHARARFAVEFNAGVPKVNDQGIVKLIDAKHPLLMLKQKPNLYEMVMDEKLIEKAETVVPLNIEFGKSNAYMVMITGPNTGGKTVALKTIGILALMTYLAIPIPASPDSDIGLFQDIFADVGDEQSIEKGLSTFSSHIRNLTKIVKRANDKTLVLIDEIGNGTDPEEGSLLAMAIMDDWLLKKTRGVITTHYGALKVYAYQKEGMINASMEFDRKNFQPTYRMLLNVPGNSFAVEIAKNLGIPGYIISNAQKRQNEQEAKLNDIIIDLQKKVSLYEDKLRELGMKESQLQEMIGEYEDKTRHIKQYINQAKTQALEEANRIVEGARSVVEKVVTEIKESHAEKDTIVQGREIIDQIRKEIKQDLHKEKETRQSDKKPLDNPQLGDFVWVESLQSVGEITQMSHHGPKVQIRFGNIMVLTSREDLFPMPDEMKNQAAPVPALPHMAYGTSPNLGTQVDVRGFSCEQAIKKVDEFLSRICVADINQVRVLHGLGNGILKTFIRDFLKTYPVVSHFSPGDAESGGDGVTIVYL
ncbi:MAG: endonuclease MutS2, partial [Candidatus Delongbacteria bacterium]|nr:endonuclease MutS2 [Candidatus Delongbacteria bacterium]